MFKKTAFFNWQVCGLHARQRHFWYHFFTAFLREKWPWNKCDFFQKIVLL